MSLPRRKSEWWPDGGWRHGEPFPLPLQRVHGRNAAAPELLREAWAVPPRMRRRVDGVVSGLNQLACSQVNSVRGQVRAEMPKSLRPTGLQASIVASLAHRVQQYGDPDWDLTARKAFESLVASKDLYSQCPQNLAKFDLDRLKVSAGGIVPVDLCSRLPPAVAALLRNSSTCIEKPEDEVRRIIASEEFPSLYWDPTLKESPKKRRAFLLHMCRLAIFGVRQRARGFV